jgi:hypothetical protein
VPYIEQRKRLVLDWLVERMAPRLKADGDLNYVLFAFALRHVKPGYQNYRNFIGELNECAAEIRRRLLAPYEDAKIIENGDVDG